MLHVSRGGVDAGASACQDGDVIPVFGELANNRATDAGGTAADDNHLPCAHDRVVPSEAPDDTIATMSESPTEPVRRATLLVYASDARVRDRVRVALGSRPSPDLEVELVEASTGEDVVRRCDLGGIDLAILDGEAAPTGGLGLCRQLKSELDDAPPVLVLLGRRDDAWLATWSRADGVALHPVDALQVTDAVLSLLQHNAGVVGTGH